MQKFAFLIHPRYNIREDMTRVFPFFKYIPLPNIILEFIVKYFPPIISGKIYYNNEHRGYNIVVPLTGRQFFLGRKYALKKVEKAVQYSKSLGCQLVGLGSLTSPITLGGKLLRGKVENVAITNGNALSVGIIYEAVEKIIDEYFNEIPDLNIAVVGATKSVGQGISHLLACNNHNLLLVDRPAKNGNSDYKSNRKLVNLIANLKNYSDTITATVNMNDLKSQDIIIVTTSALQNKISMDHLKKGSIIYDDTQPRNTDQTLKNLDDILIIDGGWLHMPGFSVSKDIDLPPEHAYACLVESYLLSCNGRTGDFCVGYVTPKQVEEIMQLFNASDWSLAPFLSFGESISEKKINNIKMLIKKNFNKSTILL